MWLAFIIGCNEYGFLKEPPTTAVDEDVPTSVVDGTPRDTGDPPVPTEDTGEVSNDDTSLDDTGEPPDTDPPEDTGPGDLEVLQCDDSYAASLPWKKSPLWFDATEPVDADGRPWFASDYTVPADWVDLPALPDIGGDADHEVFYRATFWLDAAVGTTELEFVGNDGVWLYVNDQFVGHWGGDWREGGCINVPSGCEINYYAPPTDISSFLQAGANTIAVMLTNGPAGYTLDIDASCVE